MKASVGPTSLRAAALFKAQLFASAADGDRRMLAPLLKSMSGALSVGKVVADELHAVLDRHPTLGIDRSLIVRTWRGCVPTPMLTRPLNTTRSLFPA
jgi:hypothetical protein